MHKTMFTLMNTGAPTFNDLLAPTYFTTEIALIVLGMLSLFLIGGIWLRSVLVISVWVFTAMSFIITVVWQTDLLYFWLISLFNIMTFPVVILVRGVYNVRV